jgi:hypothetical protein
MKYKLLNKKGAHFVCLEDGTQIPLQVSATVQFMFEKCRTTVEAFCDERMGLPDDPKLRFKNGGLTYGQYVLDGAQVLSYKKGTQGMDWTPGIICFTVDCELPDTIEQPKPYGHVLYGNPAPELS